MWKCLLIFGAGLSCSTFILAHQYSAVNCKYRKRSRVYDKTLQQLYLLCCKPFSFSQVDLLGNSLCLHLHSTIFVDVSVHCVFNLWNGHSFLVLFGWLWLSLLNINVALTLLIRVGKVHRIEQYVVVHKTPPTPLPSQSDFLVQCPGKYSLSPVGFPHKTLHPPRRRIPLITDRREHSAAHLGDSTAQHGSFTQHRDSTNCQGMLAAGSSHSGSCKKWRYSARLLPPEY